MKKSELIMGLIEHRDRLIKLVENSPPKLRKELKKELDFVTEAIKSIIDDLAKSSNVEVTSEEMEEIDGIWGTVWDKISEHILSLWEILKDFKDATELVIFLNEITRLFHFFQ
jgi:hypothetical protein